MMMMLTTQLTYTPTFSASARSQTLQSNIPLNTNNASTAIGLVETDSYETGEQSMQVVGNPQARSGAHMSGVIFLILAGAAGFLVAQKPVREMLGDFFRKMTGGNHNESSHRNNAIFADDEERQPSRSGTQSTVVNTQRHHQHQQLATT
jgi:hypothetical protein